MSGVTELDETQVSGRSEPRDRPDPAATRATRSSLDETVVRGQPIAAAAPPELARGAVIGRYVILDRLGAGAMGVVLSAFDPELDRKVALKLLQAGAAGPSLAQSRDARARLLREAQALARLSHPNVVAIHDVGTHGDAVWIAMELVEGRTLGRWIDDTRPGWRELLAVMKAVGRGLAAAHAVGLVHRDVKPDNIMVSDDGRARVMDFGLARRGGPAPVDAPVQPTTISSEMAMLAAEVTVAGSIVGTPAYMAPEQLAGAEVGPAADIFAFCVTLWQGIHGERPFAGATLHELREAIEAGRITAPRRRDAAPRWLHAALVRGLAADPGRRFADMNALLAAFDRGEARTRRRRRLGVALGAIVGVGAAALGISAWERAEVAARREGCQALAAGVDTVWGENARARLDSARRRSPLPFAGDTATRVQATLEAWAAEWGRGRAATCGAHEGAGGSADLRARADACLDERLVDLEALVTELAAGEAEVVSQAIEAASELAPAGPCGDARALARRPVLPSGDLEAVADLRAALARIDALEHAGRYEAALALADASLPAAEALGWPPAVVEVQLRRGRFEARLARFEAAAATLEDAYFEASKAGVVDVAADAAITLIGVVGERLARHDEGLRWARLAELGLLSMGEAEGTLRAAELATTRGLVRRAAGRHDEALADLTGALAIYESIFDPAHPTIAVAINDIAAVEGDRGDPARVREAYARALVLAERAFGPDHPKVALILNNLATAHGNLGELAEAAVLYERSVALRQRTLGADHPDVADTITNLATVHFLQGEVDAVEADLARARAIYERVHGPRHPSVADNLTNLGYILDALGRPREAIPPLERALEIFREVHGDGGHVRLAACVSTLGLARLHVGELDAAEALHREALALRERLLPAAHPSILASRRNLALVALARGEALRARALLEEASALPAKELAGARFALAQALWATAAERPAARALAELALQGHEDAGRAGEGDAVRAWLAEHPATR